ncbi:MAG: hypothetical protein EBY16_06030 [Gammaproteobacteria bacterium]|nr:hypothetical protein [Gammaproteobacteria bacterium]
MAGAKDGPYLGSVLGHITAIANANESAIIAEYCKKRWGLSVDIGDLAEMSDEIFKGIRPFDKKPPYQVENDISDSETPESLAVVNVFLRHVEADNNLKIDGDIAVAFDCGDSTSDELYNKLVDIFDKTYFRQLGLYFDPQKTTFVDMKTGKVPTQSEFENRIKLQGQLAQSKFKEAGIAAKILKQGAEVNTESIMINYAKRKTATLSVNAQELTINQESGRPMSSQNS